jgi:hypothetical protein
LNALAAMPLQPLAVRLRWPLVMNWALLAAVICTVVTCTHVTAVLQQLAPRPD